MAVYFMAMMILIPTIAGVLLIERVNPAQMGELEQTNSPDHKKMVVMAKPYPKVRWKL